ncbi:hypothetical protein [Treponema sp.]|uniref:hypothetical protein n=1 Tax=Treponema sp. TaxID=166 RepID=UPI003F1182A2
MKQFLLFLHISIFFLFSVSAKNIPDWLKNPEKEFPEEKFIYATGKGNSEKSAQNSALANISLYFDVKTDIVMRSVKELGDFQSDREIHSVDSESYFQINNISSSADFFLVKFTESYYDKKTDTFSILAYINRTEAAQIYSMRIEGLLNSIRELKSSAKTESEPFFAAETLRKAEELGKIAENYIKCETTIIPDNLIKYKPELKMISEIARERTELKKSLTFSINMNTSEKKYSPVFTTVASVLEKNGYSYSLENSKYKILINISGTEESYKAGEFVRLSIDVLILNDSGNGVYTYSKAFGRTGGKTLEQAYILAINNIKNDLEENFLSE